MTRLESAVRYLLVCLLLLTAASLTPASGRPTTEASFFIGAAVSLLLSSLAQMWTRPAVVCDVDHD